MQQIEQIYDIIVVGAGIAGLACAAKLQQAGLKVLVVEARNRLGGRIWTDHSLGVPLDLGASWIHGIKHNPIAKLVQQYGIKTFASNTDNLSFKRYNSLSLYDWEGKKISKQEINHLVRRLEDLEIFIKNAQVFAEKDVSYKSIVKKFISMHHFTERERRIFKYAVSAAIEYEYAEDASKISLQEFGKDEPFAGQDVLFAEGYEQIVKHLAEGLDIRINERVNKVVYNEDGAEVRTEYASYKTNYVVMTIPLGVLKVEKDLFSPPLPRAKSQAIRRLQMGILNKVYLQFDTPFWDLDSEVIGYIPTSKLSWIEFINYFKYIKKPILLAFNAGSRARQIEQWPQEKIIASIMQALTAIYGDKVQNPTAFLITHWNEDPLARGSYSYIPVGVAGSQCEKLGEPILNRLFFAGEATNDKTLSTVHGAYLSGVTAAQQILALRS